MVGHVATGSVPPLLLLGESPSPRLVDRPALTLLPHLLLDPEPAARRHANAADRLLLWSGVPVDRYLAAFERTNLLRDPRDARRGRLHAAYRAGLTLRAQPPRRVGVVALGVLVRRALIDAGCEVVLPCPRRRFDALLWAPPERRAPLPIQCMPHPAGRNKHTNDPELRAELGARLRAIVDEALQRS